MNGREFFDMLCHMRAAWCAAFLDRETIALCERNGVRVTCEGGATDAEVMAWGNWQWHVKHCITRNELGLFFDCFDEYRREEALFREYIASYTLSIAPLNVLLRNGVQKFLPRLGFRPAPDPYGVQRAHSVVLREEDGKTYYLSTHKPGYASFLPILGARSARVYCPIGCAGCYRGPQTRFSEPLRIIHEDGTREDVLIPEPAQQTRWLVEQWNTNPDFMGVYDILFSGGEPMMLSNDTWRRILVELRHAKYLRCFRICTGALFLGFPFRFDDMFIQLLTSFREETGVQVKLAVHVSHPEHVTPEAVFFARKLIRAGIELLPQCPLEPRVNFWECDFNRTIATLRELDRLLSCVVGVRPYKWILDMQGGVSLLSAIEVWRELHDRHQGESDITRPTSFAFFLPHGEGNTNISTHTIHAMNVRVDQERGLVYYTIPHPSGKTVFYEESLSLHTQNPEEHLTMLKAQWR